MPDSAWVSRLHPSPNVEPRRDGARPSILLLHYTGLADVETAIDWLSRPESKVSCHYVIAEDGEITQMVPEALRAWHAGLSCWQGERDINSWSVGIEIHNPGHEAGKLPYPAIQMEAVARLSADIITRHAIPPQRVLAHSDVAPQRKIDPGEWFDWAWLAERGIGHWVAPAPVAAPIGAAAEALIGPEAIERFTGDLAAYGYDIAPGATLDASGRKVVAAFQRHFRTAVVDGFVDHSTVLTLGRLIDAMNLDGTA